MSLNVCWQIIDTNSVAQSSVCDVTGHIWCPCVTKSISWNMALALSTLQREEIVTSCITQSTLSLALSVQWRCHRHIVGSLHHHVYVPSASLAKFRVIPDPPSSYQTRSCNKPFHSTSLLHLAPLSLCNPSHISGHGNLWSEHHTDILVHHMLVLYYHAFPYIWYSFYHVLIAILQTIMFQLIII